MINSANSYLVSQLFGIDVRVVYAIPRYQREYTWDKAQWETLFDDVQENKPGYFLGSIICINQGGDVLDVQSLEVVDGQQRLTTLSLLFAALYEYLKRHRGDMDDDQTAQLSNLKNKLVLRNTDNEVRISPQIQNNNNNDYRAILHDAGVIGQCDIPRYAGNRKIFRAFRYFQSRIEEMANGESRSNIMDLLDKVNQSILVKIEVGSHADAYTLFESLNNRGMPLTAIDLIRNKLLARLEHDKPDKVDQYFYMWSRLLGHLGDDYSIQERFFRHYYNAFRDSLNEPFRNGNDMSKYPLGPMATRSNLTQIYEKLINQEASEHLQAICSAGELYSLMISNNTDKAWEQLENPLKDLDRIQGSPSYLLMLYLLVQCDALAINVAQIREIAKLLVSFFVRRNLTDTPPTRDLDRLFMAVIDKIAMLSGDAVVGVIREELLAVSANDESFRSKLEGRIYEESTHVTRFVLCALAEQSMTREILGDLWRYEGRKLVWTIEHIFPQGKNIPKSWVNMIAGGDEDNAKDIQETHVHKLGNLTISGYNSTLGNKGFIDKRDRTNNQGQNVGYKNGLELNAELATADTWSVEQINERTTKLVDQVVNLFSMT